LVKFLIEVSVGDAESQVEFELQLPQGTLIRVPCERLPVWAGAVSVW
jgi:hypothetical protein